MSVGQKVWKILTGPALPDLSWSSERRHARRGGLRPARRTSAPGAPVVRHPLTGAVDGVDRPRLRFLTRPLAASPVPSRSVGERVRKSERFRPDSRRASDLRAARQGDLRLRASEILLTSPDEVARAVRPRDVRVDAQAREPQHRLRSSEMGGYLPLQNSMYSRVG